MPSAIVTTPAATTANSYVSVAEAEVYFGDRLHSLAWVGATADEKAVALLMAARRIDQSEFLGTRWKLEQSMAWPRYGVLDEDGWLIAADVIPERVKRAQMEEALGLLTTDEDPDARDALAGLSRVKVDVVEVEATGASGARTGLLPSTRRLLRPFLASSGASVPLYRS